MAQEPTTALVTPPSSRAIRVYAIAATCLFVGLAIGYVLRDPQIAASPVKPVSLAGQSVATAGATTARPMFNPQALKPLSVGHGTAADGKMPSLQQMKQMADKQAAPLLAKLKSDPKNSLLLSQVAGLYHADHQFKEAVDYYQKALQADPKNVAIRTRLATSLYRSGDADGAIAQLNQALVEDPKDANALFNLGMIKLQAKQDSKGALAAWQRLLQLNPQLSADRKATVQKLIVEVAARQGDPAGIEGARSNDPHQSHTN